MGIALMCLVQADCAFVLSKIPMCALAVACCTRTPCMTQGLSRPKRVLQLEQR